MTHRGRIGDMLAPALAVPAVVLCCGAPLLALGVSLRSALPHALEPQGA